MRGAGSAGSAIDERPGGGRAARPEHRFSTIEFTTPATMLEDVRPPVPRAPFRVWTAGGRQASTCCPQARRRPRRQPALLGTDLLAFVLASWLPDPSPRGLDTFVR